MVWRQLKTIFNVFTHRCHRHEHLSLPVITNPFKEKVNICLEFVWHVKKGPTDWEALMLWANIMLQGGLLIRTPVRRVRIMLNTTASILLAHNTRTASCMCPTFTCFTCSIGFSTNNHTVRNPLRSKFTMPSSLVTAFGGSPRRGSPFCTLSLGH